MHDGPPPQHWWPPRCGATRPLVSWFPERFVSSAPARRPDNAGQPRSPPPKRPCFVHTFRQSPRCILRRSIERRSTMRDAKCSRRRMPGKKVQKQPRKQKDSVTPSRVSPSSRFCKGESLTAQQGPRSHNAVREATQYRAYQAEELCEVLSVKVATQRAVNRPQIPSECLPRKPLKLLIKHVLGDFCRFKDGRRGTAVIQPTSCHAFGFFPPCRNSR